MPEVQLIVTPEEKECLSRLLATALREGLVEEHRTDRPAFRELVHRDNALIQSLLAKVKKPAC